MTGNSLGSWIREERKAGKMNQTELGELVGASQVDISKWETGKRLPDEATVASLEELFLRLTGGEAIQELAKILRD